MANTKFAVRPRGKYGGTASKTRMVSCNANRTMKVDHLSSSTAGTLEGMEHQDTRSNKPGLCIDYLQGLCLLGNECENIHPTGLASFLGPPQNESQIHQPTAQQPAPIISAETCSDVTRLDPSLGGIPPIPTVKLPTSRAAGRHDGDTTFLVSDNLGLAVEEESTFPDSDIGHPGGPSKEQDHSYGSASGSESPSWNSETGDWGEMKVRDWMDSDVSLETTLSGISMPRQTVEYRNERNDVLHSSFNQEQEREYTTQEGSHQEGKRPRRPPCYPEKCRRWLRNECNFGYACMFVHDDLEYEPEEQERRRPWLATWMATVHDHIKVKFGAGFEVKNLTTGFETSYIYVHGIPGHVKPEEMFELVKDFGSVNSINMSEKATRFTKTARVRFSKPEEAQIALSRLKHVTAFGTVLSVRFPVSTTGPKNVVFKDGMVVIKWEPPGRTWYAGYKDIVCAEEAMAQASATSSGSPIEARIHTGLPSAGLVTVRYRGLPQSFNDTDFQTFARSEDVLWERAKYTDLPRATRIIKSILDQSGRLLSFHVQPPSPKDFKVKALAHFTSPAAADRASESLHGLSPPFTGKTKIFAHHERSIELRISYDTFIKASLDIETLRRHVWERFRHNASITVSANNPVVVELRARTLKTLGWLKLELERTISGDIVKSNGKVIWDDFFATPSGMQYMQLLQAHHSRIAIRTEFFSRKIRLFGFSKNREAVAHLITKKVLELHSQQISFIPLSGRFIGVFMSKELLDLQQDLGPENIVLDIFNRRLRIRGDDAIYRRALGLVREVYSRYSTRQVSNEYSCPVCLENPTDSIRLPCGHRWCRACLMGYLVSATNNGAFPLGCLGDEARCEQKVPVPIARDLLSTEGLQLLLEASFSAYVRSHSDELHYCPSPDCPQVYRSAQKGMGGMEVQCPSCLLRICTTCHREEHEGFSCTDDDTGDEDFQEWAKSHDVKRCPGCRISIERLEGCNHMMCTRCQTHICWVCMKTFPKGEGIYGHMRTEHGDFGLGPIL